MEEAPGSTAPRAGEPAWRELRAEIWPIFRRLPAYVRLAWALGREPGIPWQRKTLLYTAALYTVTPAHAPLGMIPVVGQLDTPVLLMLGLRQTLAHCPPEVSARHLRRLNLTAAQLDADLATALAVMQRLAKRAARGTSRRLRFAGRVAGGFTLRTARRLAGRPPRRPGAGPRTDEQ